MISRGPGVPDFAVPARMSRTVVELWGEQGRRWLAHLPELAAEVMRDWQLAPVAPFPLSINWVTSVRRPDGAAAVLKLGLPQAGHIADEGTALEFFGGAGAVRLLDRDDARGALLLEQACPGTPVSALGFGRDEEATAVLISLMRRLHRPAPPGRSLPELAARSALFSAYLRRHPGDDPLPRHLVERAGRLFDELCATATGRVVLHGDLHHDNVLRADREPWLAIDPHGAVGDPGYELGALLYNPDPARSEGGALALLPARIEQLADGLAMPVGRVVAWGFVQAVLSEVWTAEGAGLVGGVPLQVALSLLARLP
jgi:streptomycin 6-kinase